MRTPCRRTTLVNAGLPTQTCIPTQTSDGQVNLHTGTAVPYGERNVHQSIMLTLFSETIAKLFGLTTIRKAPLRRSPTSPLHGRM